MLPATLVQLDADHDDPAVRQLHLELPEVGPKHAVGDLVTTQLLQGGRDPAEVLN